SRIRGLAPTAGPGVAASLASAAGVGATTAYDASLTGAIGNAATGRQRDRSYDSFTDNLRGLAQNLSGSLTAGTLE
ncbi:hypothetical protein ACQKHG_24845, partial [Escherichia coli]|uniref:hypothetical protein n=1 Tax=Escherichia coli TaxID=562 RepID=UPI003D068FBC